MSEILATAEPVTAASRRAFRIAVVGGGITGLAAAFRLRERAARGTVPIEVVLFESATRVGGVIATEHVEGFTLEAGPDSFISEKPWALDLCRRIGLEAELIPTNENCRRSLVVRDGGLVSVPEGFSLMAPTRIAPFVRTPILSWRGKLVALKDLILPRGGPPPGGDESLASFVRRRLGTEVLDRLAQPLVSGIYAADAERLSLAATMPRFLELERRERSLILALSRQLNSAPAQAAGGARYSLFLTLRGGIGSLVEGLERRLPAGSIRTGSRVVRIDRITARIRGGGATPGWQLVLAGGDADRFDAAIVATPAHTAAPLVKPLDATLAELLAAIPHGSSAIVSLAYRRADVPHPLDAFGFVVPAIERRGLLACTFSSVKYPGRAPQGWVLLRAFVGGAGREAAVELDDPALLALVRGEFKSLLGIEAPPAFHRIHRWPAAMPQYLVGHLDRVAEIERRMAALPGLSLAGNAYRGVGLADCVRSAEAAADGLIDALAGTPLEGTSHQTVARQDLASA